MINGLTAKFSELEGKTATKSDNSFPSAPTCMEACVLHQVTPNVDIDCDRPVYTTSNPQILGAKIQGRQIEQQNDCKSSNTLVEIEANLDAFTVSFSEAVTELHSRINIIETYLLSTHNGTLVWRIADINQNIQDTQIGSITNICSPPFYTGRNGYKMYITAYLNGDGSGKKTHLSIYIVLMRGEYDSLLKWPFEHKISLIVLSQDCCNLDLEKTFKPKLSLSNNSQVSDTGGCSEFAELSILDNPCYVKEDVMYIKAIVDTSNIDHP